MTIPGLTGAVCISNANGRLQLRCLAGRRVLESPVPRGAPEADELQELGCNRDIVLLQS